MTTALSGALKGLLVVGLAALGLAALVSALHAA